MYNVFNVQYINRFINFLPAGGVVAVDNSGITIYIILVCIVSLVAVSFIVVMWYLICTSHRRHPSKFCIQC